LRSMSCQRAGPKICELRRHPAAHRRGAMIDPVRGDREHPSEVEPPPMVVHRA
jgi:hypothetical protein